MANSLITEVNRSLYEWPTESPFRLIHSKLEFIQKRITAVCLLETYNSSAVAFTANHFFLFLQN